MDYVECHGSFKRCVSYRFDYVFNHLKGVKRMKGTRIRYCAECYEDFQDGEKVWYTPLENTCFCSSCKEKIDTKQWEPRRVVFR